MKKVVITGARGQIGRVLTAGLSGKYRIRGIDLPEHDLTDWPTAVAAVEGADVVVHLAWDTVNGNARKHRRWPPNEDMSENVFLASRICGVRRVIFASSVHVEDYRHWNRSYLLSPMRDAVPDSPYGSQKLAMEALGKWHSELGLEFIAVRFGGVAPRLEPWDDIPIVGLSHPDCIAMIRTCIDIDMQSMPGNFAVFYAVSDNGLRQVHDTVNPFGWHPKDDAAEFYCIKPGHPDFMWKPDRTPLT